MSVHEETTATGGYADGLSASSSAPAGALLARPARTEAPVTGPAPSADVYRAFLDHSAIGYIIYLVGAVTAFLAVSLSLSDAQAGLHSSALAAGMVSAGVAADRVDRLVGQRASHMLAAGLIMLAAVVLAWAPSFAATLSSAAVVGLGCGLISAHINHTLTAGGGPLARVQMSRSTLLSMVASVSVPVVIGLGIGVGVGWQFAILPAMGLALATLLMARSRRGKAAGAVVDRARLPAAFWLAWILVVLVVAAEFAIVFWGSTLVERRADVSLGEATLTISAFIGGMIIGRLALSFHVIGRMDPMWLVRGGITVAVVGSLLAWATSSYELAGLGFLLAGGGLGMLFPLGAAVSIAAAPGRESVAAGRLVMASGTAILLAPLVLGVVADIAGVTTAWLLVPAICVAALLLTLPVGRSSPREQAGAGHGSDRST